jgi:hypothetical protein
MMVKALPHVSPGDPDSPARLEPHVVGADVVGCAEPGIPAVAGSFGVRGPGFVGDGNGGNREERLQLVERLAPLVGDLYHFGIFARARGCGGQVARREQPKQSQRKFVPCCDRGAGATGSVINSRRAGASKQSPLDWSDGLGVPAPGV